ncbi:hypothetical protein F511_46805 [Dorcoceras hygrometricum]|uniref:Uncharacterized protein n=1 Tax=Dorcoceras hygrometricum TaxID=472368 RepID=A0A2Z6ZZX9_9LAMI|nr:hypothetical protein F511_46805 [Dorcoceras hygrometricum]
MIERPPRCCAPRAVARRRPSARDACAIVALGRPLSSAIRCATVCYWPANELARLRAAGRATRAWLRRLLASSCDDGAWSAALVAAARAPLRRTGFRGGGHRPAAAPAMSRRLISSKFLVRACPGQPVKFSGRYAISDPF